MVFKYKRHVTLLLFGIMSCLLGSACVKNEQPQYIEVPFQELPLPVPENQLDIKSYGNEAGSALERIEKSKNIRVGLLADAYPFCYTNKRGKLVGLDVDYANQIARSILGKKAVIHFVILDAPERIDALNSGEVDILVANLAVTKTHAKEVLFSKPYLQSGVGVLSRLGAKSFTEKSELKGHSVVVAKGSAAEKFLEDYSSKVNLIRHNSYTEAFAAFKLGAGDALAADSLLLSAWASQNDGYTLSSASLDKVSSIACAVKNGEGALAARVAQITDKLASRGFFRQGYYKHLLPCRTFGMHPEEILLKKHVQ